MSFGDFFRELRLKNNMTLREFCLKYNFDPGNISKIETGIFNAPTSNEILERYAKALHLKKGSNEYIKFYDLAMASKMPSHLVKNIKDKELLNNLPILFRTVDNEGMTTEKLEKIIKFVKKELTREI